LIIFGGYSAYTRNSDFLFFYRVALYAGDFGLISYILTAIPGMARRFGIKHKLISILMIYRRYAGITMFLAVFCHYVILRGAILLRNGLPKMIPPTFEIMGTVALFLTFFLFLTSNDYSVVHLKKWWNTIHKLTYIIIWFVALHLLLQKVSIWSLLIGLTVILQVSSYFYSKVRKNINHITS
jgi:DMSO/TMAO reductase YedYZ heme-binding membrane subunit